jgi:CheY-like chemotaxis protein
MPKIPEPPKRALDADGLPRVTPPPGTRFPIPRPATYDLDESAVRLIAEAEAEKQRPATFDFEESGVRHAEPDQAPSFDDDASAAARAIDALDASASRIPAPAAPAPDTGLSIDIDLEESKPAAAAYQPPRAISVAESPALDVVVDGHAIEPLAIAILDEPPYVAAAKQAISVAGHKVAAAASGQAGIEQLKSLLRSGSADVVLVGLPGGEALIDTALALAPRRPVVIAAMAGKPVDAVRKAVSLGADLAVTRPIDADKLAPVLLAASRLCAERDAAGAKGSGGLDALADHEPGTLQPFESFQRVVELEIKRSKRHGYPIAIALFSVGVDSDEPPPPGVQGILRARAGNALIHTIRDIDLATELDSEQFLVLLPYTTIGGAAEVARRILHAVSSGNPLNAAGKTFAPSITGAVAGAKTGEPMSFTRLMRDATQALEEARADGAELAVPMGTPD